MAVFVVTSNGETVEGTSGQTLLSRAGLGCHLLSSFRQQFKAKVYSEDGEIRPIMAVVELPKRGSISVRNLGQVSRAGQEEGSRVELLRQALRDVPRLRTKPETPNHGSQFLYEACLGRLQAWSTGFDYMFTVTGCYG